MVLMRQADPEVIIRARNLIKTYSNGVTALTGINLSITKGEMVGLLGASGSGKTTFFRLINGSLAPTGGDLFVLGKFLRGLSHKSLREIRTGIAMVYQHHNIIPGLSVARNVLLGRLGQMSLLQLLRMAFYLKDNEVKDVYRVLDWLGQANKIFDRATDLSGGQQQRVAIARALVGNAQIILADEPIASVDYRTAESILDIFKKLNSENKVTVIMNLHQEDFALNYCSRVVVLDKGRLVYDGPPEKWITERRSSHIG